MTPTRLEINNYDFICRTELGVIKICDLDEGAIVVIPNEIFIKMVELFLKVEKERSE